MMEVGQVHRFGTELVNVGCPQPGIPQAPQVVALVVRHDDDHVGLWGLLLRDLTGGQYHHGCDQEKLHLIHYGTDINGLN